MTTALKIFVLAVISVALAIIIEQAIAAAVNIFGQKEIILESYTHFTWFLFIAAAIEEISKYWAIYFVIRERFNLEKIKLILASFFLGITWGILEIGLIIYTNKEILFLFLSGKTEVVFSFFSIIALHTLTALLLGTIISADIFSGILRHLKILFFPVLVHLLFNFLIIQKSSFTNYLIILSLGIIFFTSTVILFFNYKNLHNR